MISGGARSGGVVWAEPYSRLIPNGEGVGTSAETVKSQDENGLVQEDAHRSSVSRTLLGYFTSPLEEWLAEMVTHRLDNLIRIKEIFYFAYNVFSLWRSGRPTVASGRPGLSERVNSKGPSLCLVA